MENLFCPFIKENCRFDCAFNNGCFDDGDKENCNLVDAVDTIRGLQIPNNPIDEKLQKIISEIGSVYSQTSDLSSIRTEIEEINTTLKKSKN